MNKLDYLAQKEEELRRLNEQLEMKNKRILEDDDKHWKKNDLDDSLDNDKQGHNPFEDENENQDPNQDYEEEKVVQPTKN